ncbi:major facilitator superfamily domain-containing protein [Massariosphaeria phaeospora]|uniref:Major facilitator superfamily domain-containing protein n=1 Tax=Massariosphaeria phaeospora TaxID=100035 RepID=A0A7C8MMG5_9PLEO|nr:major facilitator superfamily domain-containing protein [Massariosphaeria phaeospora]
MSSINTKTYKDGGATAWLQVFGCWLLFMNTWGLTNTFSIFSTHYAHTLFPSLPPAHISWIDSLQLFLTLFTGIFASWALDAGHLRAVLLTGTTLLVGGMLATSFCAVYWQVLLAQGVCVGLGSGALAFTAAAVVPFYTGSSVAGTVYPLMLRELFETVGFAWAVRVLAFVILAGLLGSLAVLKPHGEHKTHAPFFVARYLYHVPYTLFILAYAFMVRGTYVPYFYIQQYALELGTPASTTFILVSVMNAATFVGRFPYNYLADTYGGIAVLVPCCMATSLILFLWRFAHTPAGLFTISATFCFVTGGLVSLPAVTIANLTLDKADYRTRMGMGYTVAAIGALVGTPVAGAFRCGPRGVAPFARDAERVMARWQGTWFVAAAAMFVAALLMVWARVLRGGWEFRLKI